MRAAKAASVKAANDIGGVPDAERKNAGALGHFTDTDTIAEIVEGIDGRPELIVSIYGKEQTEAGLIDEPALTIRIDSDGEVTVNGPARGSATFDEFQKRGWAKATKAGFGRTRLNDVTNEQLVNMLGDAHARVLAWKGVENTGLRWKRHTGAK